MVKDLILLGIGNHDIIRLVEEINDYKKQYNLIGILEKDPTQIGKEVYGYPILGTDELLLSELKKCSVVCNVMATPTVHLNIFNRLIRQGIKDFPSLIHPSVIVKHTSIGIGNIIYEHVNLGTDVHIGNYNILYPNTTIGHEAKIGDSNLFALNIVIGARSTICNCNLFGNASTLSLGLTVGDNNMIGVGSVVLDNVKENCSLLGNPAVDSMITLTEHVLRKKGKLNKK